MVEGRAVRLPPELTPEQERELAESRVLKGERENDAAKMTPQVMVLSSGEMTPFLLQLTAPGLDVGYRLEADALGRVQLVRSAIKARV